MRSEGVLYVAFGAPHLLMALHSARTFRRSNPARGVTVITDIEVPDEAIEGFDPKRDRIVVVDSPASENRLFKTSASQHTTFDRTLLLDADTVVLKHLDAPFRLLDYADVLLKLDPKGQNRPWQRHEEILDLGEFGGLPAWNGGVIFFRQNLRTDAFFREWSERFILRGSPFDQPALLETTLVSDAKVLPLDERWNCPTGRFERSGGVGGPVSILHYMSQMPPEVMAGVDEVAGRLGQRGKGLHADFLRYVAGRQRSSGSGLAAPSRVRQLLSNVFGRRH